MNRVLLLPCFNLLIASQHPTTRTHTHTHTRRYAPMHTETHAHKHTHAQRHNQTHTHTDTHAHTLRHTHTQLYRDTHTNTHTHRHPHTLFSDPSYRSLSILLQLPLSSATCQVGCPYSRDFSENATATHPMSKK